ncbi:hypothetical protein D3C72_1536370 [compost metagenome]
MPQVPCEGPIRRLLRGVRRRLCAHRAHQPVFGPDRRHARTEIVRPLFLQVVGPALRGIPAAMDHRGQCQRRQAPAARNAGQDARMAGRRRRRGQAGRLGHLPRRALFRHRDPGRAGQVLLRVAGRAGGLPGFAQVVLRGQGHGLRRPARPRRRHRTGPLHRQGHRVLPRPVLARDAEVRRPQDAGRRERARVHHRQRRKDVQEPRHRHLAAALPGNRHERRMDALLHRRQAECAGRRHGLQPRGLHRPRQ